MVSDRLEALRAMVHRVERRDVGEESLGSADVGGGLVPSNVLFTCLHGHAVSGLALRVDRHPDDATGHLSRHGLVRREEPSVRSAVAHRHTEALRRADGYVRSPRARRLQVREGEEVARARHLATRRLDLSGELCVVEDGAVGGRILHERARDLLGELERLVVAGDNLHAKASRPRLHDGQCLRVDALVDEKGRLLALGLAMNHCHCLCRCGRLVEEGGVTQLEARQVTHHGLEGHQTLEAALRHLGLVWGVLRVPARVFEHVAQDNHRCLCIVVAHPDERAIDHVRRGNAT
mmetsp:Transcript_36211/g.72001  ORF Transcript_36211/g.72001 Transcript_36211/m.72001 type:complete len:292 (-) Transcript_36211:371-1246(-)